jgi:hypothetical protein
VEWIHLAQDSDQQRGTVSVIPAVEYVDFVSDRQLLRVISAKCSLCGL